MPPPPLTGITAKIWAMPNKNGSRWRGLGIQRAVPASTIHHHWIPPVKTAGGVGVPHSAGLSVHNSSRQTTGYFLRHCCFPEEAGSKLPFPKTAASVVLAFKISDGVTLTFLWSAEVKGQPSLFSSWGSYNVWKRWGFAFQGWLLKCHGLCKGLPQQLLSVASRAVYARGAVWLWVHHLC